MSYPLVGATDPAAKLCPHFLQIVTPRFASVPHAGQIRRVGFVINHMIERIRKPINQTQKTLAAPMLFPAVNPASQAPLFVAVSQEDVLSLMAYATINAPIASVKIKTTQVILRQRNGFFTASTSIAKHCQPPSIRQAVASWLP